MQTQSRASSLPAKQESDRHKARWDSYPKSERVSWPNLVLLLCRWYVAFRSFRAHIRIQSSRAKARVDCGAALQFRDGHYHPNERTSARAEGIERLQANYPWTDCVDLQIFLRGFDAGEEFGKGILAQGQRNEDSPNIPS